MVTCCAYGCTNRSNPSKPGVTFHCFPANLLRMKWIIAVRRKNWHPTVHSRICSDHFVESDFQRALSRVRIKNDAVPSVFKSFPKDMQKEKSCRKPRKYLTKRNMNLEMPPSVSQQDLNGQTDLIDEIVKSPSSNLQSNISNQSFTPYPSFLEESLSPEISNSVKISPPSPPKKYYKGKLKEMEKKLKKLEREIKGEKQKNRRQERKIANLSTILAALQKE